MDRLITFIGRHAVDLVLGVIIVALLATVLIVSVLP